MVGSQREKAGFYFISVAETWPSLHLEDPKHATTIMNFSGRLKGQESRIIRAYSLNTGQQREPYPESRRQTDLQRVSRKPRLRTFLLLCSTLFVLLSIVVQYSVADNVVPKGEGGAADVAQKPTVPKRKASKPRPQRKTMNLTELTASNPSLKDTFAAFFRIAIPRRALKRAIRGLPESPLSSDTCSTATPLKTELSGKRKISPLLRHLNLNTEQLYSSLLVAPSEASRKSMAVFEIGSFDSRQCGEAANAGYFIVICVEPSPSSFARLDEGLSRLNGGTWPENIVALQVAMSSQDSQPELEMNSIGGTGDHLGSAFPGEIPAYQDVQGNGGKVQVPTATLDGLWESISAAYRIAWDEFIEGNEWRTFRRRGQQIKREKEAALKEAERAKAAKEAKAASQSEAEPEDIDQEIAGDLISRPAKPAPPPIDPDDALDPDVDMRRRLVRRAASKETDQHEDSETPPAFEPLLFHLAKIDTQGHDGHVLAGSSSLLSRGIPRYMMTEMWPLALKHQGTPCVQVITNIPPAYRIHELQLLGLDVDLDRTGYREEWLNKAVDVESWCGWWDSKTKDVGGPKGTFGLWTDLLLERRNC